MKSATRHTFSWLMTCPMAEQSYAPKRAGGYHTTVALGGERARRRRARTDRLCRPRSRDAGHEWLRGAARRQRDIDVPVIVLTGAGSYDRCIQAVRLGAYGFIDKSEPIQRVVQEIENAVSRGRLATGSSLRSRLDGESSLIGDSAPMRSLREAIARVAPIPSSVLIVGRAGPARNWSPVSCIDEDQAQRRRLSP